MQEARLRALGAGSLDEVLVLVTDGPRGARVNNWEARSVSTRSECGFTYSKEPDGLSQRLETLGVKATRIPIPEGSTERELWSIFQSIEEHVHTGDTLYVDVTHGYRSLSIVLLTALDYLRLAKGVQVEQVSYGAYEARQEGTNIAPTFDLTPFFVLQQWTGALVLLEAGDFRALGQRISAAVKPLAPVLRQHTPLKGLGPALISLGEALQHNRLRDLAQVVEEADRQLSDARQTLDVLEVPEHLERAVGGLGPVRAILVKVQDEVARLRPQPGEVARTPELWGIRAAAYCVDHGLVVQGLTLAREVAFDYLIRVTDLGAERRKEVENLLGAFTTTNPPDPGANPSPRYREAFQALHLDVARRPLGPSRYDEAKRTLSALTDVRNALNHAGTGDPLPKPAKLLSKAQQLIKGLEALIRELPGTAA
ncbi:MAG: TIGR02221 family CRISPR-associated protein [Deltaproteobacteria bacterium]|nr:TIGR02221 family CRISPR-associated protein [Deltaproteobacteria bacterium]